MTNAVPVNSDESNSWQNKSVVEDRNGSMDITAFGSGKIDNPLGPLWMQCRLYWWYATHQPGDHVCRWEEARQFPHQGMILEQSEALRQGLGHEMHPSSTFHQGLAWSSLEQGR
jgi:hypothetical protein